MMLLDSRTSFADSMASEPRRKADLELYRLCDPLSTAAFRGDTDKESYEYMRLAKRGEQSSERRVLVRQDLGRKPFDFIWVSLAPIIHQRVIEVLRLCGATGWSTYPVEIVDKADGPVREYHGLSVTGRCQSMFLDAEHSELVYVECPMALAPKYRGLYITKDSWDGADLFTCADKQTDFIVVTEKVRTAFAKAKVTNVRFQPTSEVEVHATDRPSIPRQHDKGLAH